MCVINASPSCLLHSSTPSILSSLFQFLPEKLLLLLSGELRKGFLAGSVSKESACNVGDPGSIPGWGRALEEGNGNPLQYSWLENPVDSGALGVIIHGVLKSRTRLGT